MSDSNVGGRKKKSGINHIWILNNIIHDQLSSVKKKPVVIQQYDYQQMFDSMDASEACGDMYSYGINDDHLKLIHEANKKIVINVKTPPRNQQRIYPHKQNHARRHLGLSYGLDPGGLLWEGDDS